MPILAASVMKISYPNLQDYQLAVFVKIFSWVCVELLVYLASLLKANTGLIYVSIIQITSIDLKYCNCLKGVVLMGLESCKNCKNTVKCPWEITRLTTASFKKDLVVVTAPLLRTKSKQTQIYYASWDYINCKCHIYNQLLSAINHSFCFKNHLHQYVISHCINTIQHLFTVSLNIFGTQMVRITEYVWIRLPREIWFS